MKYFSCLAIVLVAMVGTVRADHSKISVSFEQITADSGHYESTFVADIPDGTTSWALMVDTGDDNNWLTTSLAISLTDGSFWYDPTLGPGAGIPPQATLFGIPAFASSRFTTHISAPTADLAPLGQRKNPTAVLEDGDANIICCGDLTPIRGEQLFAMTFGSPASNDNRPGVQQLGIFTISDDARGVILEGIVGGQAGADVPTGTSPHTVPFTEWFVADGGFAVPEPSSAVLAVLGLVGLAVVRRRRRA